MFLCQADCVHLGLKRGLECRQAAVSPFPSHVKCLLFKKLLLLVNFLDLGSQDALLTEI